MRPPKRHRNPARKDFPEPQQKKKSKKSTKSTNVRQFNRDVSEPHSSSEGSQIPVLTSTTDSLSSIMTSPSQSLSVSHGPVLDISSGSDPQETPRTMHHVRYEHHVSSQMSDRSSSQGPASASQNGTAVNQPVGFQSSTSSQIPANPHISSSAQPVPYRPTPSASSGQINPRNVMGTFMQSDSSVINSEGLGLGSPSEVIYARLQVDHPPDNISSVFDHISSHIPIKIKEKVWEGEFIDFNLLLKSNRDLVNESNLEGDLTVRRGTLAVVKKTASPIKNIHVWTSAFMIYASILLEKWPNKGLELFKYLHTIRLAASRGYLGVDSVRRAVPSEKITISNFLMGTRGYGVVDVMRVHSQYW